MCVRVYVCIMHKKGEDRKEEKGMEETRKNKWIIKIKEMRIESRKDF